LKTTHSHLAHVRSYRHHWMENLAMKVEFSLKEPFRYHAKRPQI